MVDPVKIVEYYVKMLADEELLQDIGIVFELGGDIKSFTEAFMLLGVANGLHTVEAGMVAAPVVGTLIKLAMEDMGIEARETNVDYEKLSTERENERIKLLIMAAIEEDAKNDGESSGVLEQITAEMGTEEEPQETEAPAEEPEMNEETSPAPQGMGLMAKGNM
jgi:hypothetical protein